jgi:hypothetical protein
LTLKCLLPVGVPAHVELALEAVNPLWGHLVGSMRCSRRDVQEERLVGGDTFDLPQPTDGGVGQVLGEVVVGVGRRGTRSRFSNSNGFQWFMSPALKP